MIPSIARLFKSPLLTFADADDLAAGVEFGHLPFGAFVYNAGIFIPEAFDGTAPLGDVGLFQGDAVGWFVQGPLGTCMDLTLEDSANTITHGSAGGRSGLVDGNTTFNGYLPMRITAPGPLYVVASQDGTRGGTPLDSTVGALQAWVLCDPNARMGV